MPFIYLVILSFIQGITEFLPISSSAHLILLPYLLNVKDQGIIVDIAAHIGSFLAVFYFYRYDIKDMLVSFIRNDKISDERKLFIKLIIAFLPIFIIGLLIFIFNIQGLRNPKIIILTSIIFGILLYIADIKGTRKKNIKELSYKDSLIIGFSQVLAIMPGVSRSGITITSSLMQGQDRESAVKFAFLLSLPTIFFIGLGGVVEYLNNPIIINYKYLIFTIMMSFIFSLLAIKFILKWIKRSSFKIFVIYRILLGLFLYFFLK